MFLLLVYGRYLHLNENKHNYSERKENRNTEKGIAAIEEK